MSENTQIAWPKLWKQIRVTYNFDKINFPAQLETDAQRNNNKKIITQNF